MKIVCSACNTEYEVETALIGKRVECQCGNKFDISDEKVKRRHFKSKLAGANYYMPAIGRFLAEVEQNIIIEPNPNNEYDENVIQILNASNRELLGHVERNIAAIISVIDGEAVKFQGKLIPRKSDFIVDFEYFYLPLLLPTKEELRKQLQKLQKTAVQFLQEYVSALQSPKYRDICDFELLERAEKSLYVLDPENSLIQDSDAIQKWKRFEAIMNSVPKDTGTMKSAFNDILQGAQVEYSAKNKPISFLKFPMPENIDLNCRFAEKNIVFTGFWPEEKAQLFPIVELLQIKQPSGVCKKLDFLVCGSNAGPSKIKKAKQMEIPIIQAADFIIEITREK